MAPKDIYGAAKLLIDRRGAGANSNTIWRLLEMRAARGKRGERAWMGVFDAALEMEQPGRQEGGRYIDGEGRDVGAG
jgi:hypothetical protein